MKRTCCLANGSTPLLIYPYTHFASDHIFVTQPFYFDKGRPKGHRSQYFNDITTKDPSLDGQCPSGNE